MRSSPTFIAKQCSSGITNKSLRTALNVSGEARHDLTVPMTRGNRQGIAGPKTLLTSKCVFSRNDSINLSRRSQHQKAPEEKNNTSEKSAASFRDKTSLCLKNLKANLAKWSAEMPSMQDLKSKTAGQMKWRSVDRLKNKVQRRLEASSSEPILGPAVTRANKTIADISSPKKIEGTSPKSPEDTNASVELKTFFNEFSKNLTIPYAYELNAPNVLQMDYERGKATALGRRNVQLTLLFISVALAFGYKVYLQQEKQFKRQQASEKEKYSKFFKDSISLRLQLENLFERLLLDGLRGEGLQQISSFNRASDRLVRDITKSIKQSKKRQTEYDSSSCIFGKRFISEINDHINDLETLKQEVEFNKGLVEALMHLQYEDLSNAITSINRLISPSLELEKEYKSKLYAQVLKKIKSENYVEKAEGNQDTDDFEKYVNETFLIKGIDRKLIALAYAIKGMAYSLQAQSSPSKSRNFGPAQDTALISVSIHLTHFGLTNLIFAYGFDALESSSFDKDIEIAIESNKSMISRYPDFPAAGKDYCLVLRLRADKLIAKGELKAAEEIVDRALKELKRPVARINLGDYKILPRWAVYTKVIKAQLLQNKAILVNDKVKRKAFHEKAQRLLFDQIDREKVTSIVNDNTLAISSAATVKPDHKEVPRFVEIEKRNTIIENIDQEVIRARSYVTLGISTALLGQCKEANSHFHKAKRQIKNERIFGRLRLFEKDVKAACSEIDFQAFDKFCEDSKEKTVS